MANLHNVYIRTGCFCNPGACQRHMNLTNDQLRSNYKAGHSCAHNIDLINGCPTGSVRASFSYMTDKDDVDRLLDMLIDCFLTQPIVQKIPYTWMQQSAYLKAKFESTFNIEHLSISDKSGVTAVKPNVVRNMFSMELKALFIYPIKSCGYYQPTSAWPLTETGLKYDREWMIVTDAGVALTQTKEPKLCFINPTIDETSGFMCLCYKGSKIQVPLEITDSPQTIASLCHSKVCGDGVEGIDCGDEISNWLSDHLQRSNVRLIRHKYRRSDDVPLTLSNKGQLLLINENTVSWLADKLKDVETVDLSLDALGDRFRANLVVSGDIEPLAEQLWNEVSVGSVDFKVEGPCSRCQMICIDQRTGKKNKEPLLSLSKALKGKINFGIYLYRECGSYGINSKICVGDKVIAKSAE